MSQVEPGEFQPRPVHFRLLYAYEACFQDGLNPSDGVIAKRLGVRRETINCWRRRNAPLRAWLAEQIGQTAVALKPWVDRRVAQLAITGSAEHTKLFYQYVAKVGVPMGEGEGGPMNVNSYQMNFLIPRPVMPALTAAPVVKDAIPVVEVR